MYHILQLF